MSKSETNSDFKIASTDTKMPIKSELGEREANQKERLQEIKRFRFQNYKTDIRLIHNQKLEITKLKQKKQHQSDYKP
jgi:hypothetical protein